MIRKTIIDIVKDAGDIDGDVESLNALVSDGYLDSYSILVIVSRLEKEFNMKMDVGEDVAARFNSIDLIEKMIKKE